MHSRAAETERFGRQQTWPNRGHIPALTSKKEITNTAELVIRPRFESGTPPNTSLQLHHYIQFLRISVTAGHLIIIIIFINCKWVDTRWQWLFYMYTECDIDYY
jgi:hypothetical protein